MQPEIKEFVIYSSPSFLPVHTYMQPSLYQYIFKVEPTKICSAPLREQSLIIY